MNQISNMRLSIIGLVEHLLRQVWFNGSLLVFEEPSLRCQVTEKKFPKFLVIRDSRCCFIDPRGSFSRTWVLENLKLVRREILEEVKKRGKSR